MKSVKVFLLLLMALFISLPLAANEKTGTFDSANVAYSKKKYDKAILLYESILKQNMESAELYYNLGNAYYQKNELAKAILNYERARKISQTDEDILTNLKLANQKTEDKLDPAPAFFLSQWKNSILKLLNEKVWSVLCILLLSFACLFLVFYFTSKHILFKQIGFYCGSLLFILAIAVFFLAMQSYNLSKNSTAAIILSPTVTVTSGPVENSKKLFILHAGCKVVINKEEGNWLEISIPNGNVGWVRHEQLEKI